MKTINLIVLLAIIISFVKSVQLDAAAESTLLARNDEITFDVTLSFMIAY